jgi:hypothetical protein
MSVLSGVKAYLAQYAGLKAGKPLWVNFLGSLPTGYSIVILPGAKTVETYLDGSSKKEFTFAFQSMESTADDLERVASSDFFETFSEWLDSQTLAGSLPTLGAKQTALSIEALGWGFLGEQGQSQTGVWQIQCKLTYEQQP